MVLRAMIDFDNNSPGMHTGGVATLSQAEPHRNRFRSRLHNKGGMMQPPSPNMEPIHSPRSNFGIGELNRRIIDLKMDNAGLTPPPSCMGDMKSPSPKLLDLNFPNGNNSHYQPTNQMTMQFNAAMQHQIRRDSNNSTTSSSYYSMKSSEMSRRSSQQSHCSSISTLRPTGAPSGGSFYDPISPGSSRRSSQLSTITSDGTNNLPPAPSSQLLTSHLARLQQYSSSCYSLPPYYNGNQSQFNQQPFGFNQQGQMLMNTQNQNFGFQQHPMMARPYVPTPRDELTSSNDRRMSEPTATTSRVVDRPPRPRSTTPTKTLELSPKPVVEAVKGSDKKKVEFHPNREVALDQLNDDEKIENKLMIPDDMLFYLNHQVDDVPPTPLDSLKLDLDLDLDQSMTSITQSIDVDKIKEEDLLSFLEDVDEVAVIKDLDEDEKEENDVPASSQNESQNRKRDDPDNDNGGNMKSESENSDANDSHTSTQSTHEDSQVERENSSSNDDILDSNNNSSDKNDSHNGADCSKLLYKHTSIYILSMET